MKKTTIALGVLLILLTPILLWVAAIAVLKKGISLDMMRHSAAYHSLLLQIEQKGSIDLSLREFLLIRSAFMENEVNAALPS